MVIVGETGGSGEAAIATRFPVTEGLIGGTTKQEGTNLRLEPQESSLVLERHKEGID